MAQKLMKMGVDEEKAGLVAQAPKGAQSDFLKRLFQTQEPEYGESEFSNKYEEAEPPGSANLQEYLMKDAPNAQDIGSFYEPEYEPASTIYKDIEKYVEGRNQGLSPKDASISDKDRYDKNLPLYEEFDRHRESLNRNEERYNVMGSLSKKLPKGIGRINVDSDGNLRFPFLANAETQRFVKTLNEFAKGAKDTFGARVTNFDLEQYMRTFPTLLNSQDGVNQIQTTRLGLKVKFVNAETAEYITGSGLGEASTVKQGALSDSFDEIKFNQSTIGITTKKALETAASRIVSRMIKKSIFKN